MVKKSYRLANLKLKKKIFTAIKAYFLKHVDIEKVLVSNKISFGEKTRNTLLVTCIKIIKLSHYR